MNESFFLKINMWVGQNPWLDHSMVFLAEWLGYFLILLLVTPLLLTLFIRSSRISSWARSLLLKLSYYREILIVSLASAFISRFVFVSTIRYFYYNPRPFEVLGGINRLIDHEATGSLPSGHASFYFALAAGIYFYNRKLGYLYFLAAGLMGFARVFAGVHWPLDILAGAILGVITAIIVYRFKNRLKMAGLSGKLGW